MKNSKKTWRLSLGANPRPEGGVDFCVWAPRVRNMQVKMTGRRGDSYHPMRRDRYGYFRTYVAGAKAGRRYAYLLDGEKERPDPCSRFQPEGVHAASAVVDPAAYRWRDAGWKGLALRDFILYEIHPGTFTTEGTFEAVIGRLTALKKLGVTCLEIMPVAQFPGRRGWGYDGVGLYAAQNSYGGPRGLKRLVDACHRHGLAVCLDVVYNHLGPEGNYLNDYGPYFTRKYHTPWGEAVNYDDAGNKHVRRFIIENAMYWVQEYHFDALRLDAVHSIYDKSRVSILRELAGRVHGLAKKLGRRVAVIAESDLNDAKIVRSPRRGGFGLDSQWSDDFHHAVHAHVTGERTGYYRDFGSMEALVKSVDKGFVYDGIYSEFRGRRHGTRCDDLSGEQFTVCLQNHDQVGNRAAGDRLSSQVTPRTQRLLAALLLLSPYTPLLFMGQEYGETAPFQYFVDHGDAGLIEAVRRGRREEFRSFGWKSVPDPAARRTFQNSRLRWPRRLQKRGRGLLRCHADLIALRKAWQAAGAFERKTMRVHYRKGEDFFLIRYRAGRRREFYLALSFSKEPRIVTLPGRGRRWSFQFHSESARYGGTIRNLKKASAPNTVLLLPESAVAGAVIR